MPRILILWNQIDEDVYAHFRREGRTTVAWDPARTIEPWATALEEMQLIHRALVAGGHEVRTVNIRDDLDGMVAAIKGFAPDAIMNLVEFLRDDAELEHHVPALFELLGVEYTGNRPRVDMRLDPDTGEPHVLEVNPNPDLAASCAFTAACAASGRDYHAMINEIVGLAVARRLAPTPTVTGIDLMLHEHRARPPA